MKDLRNAASLVFTGLSLSLLPSAVEAAEQPLSNANLKTADWNRLLKGLPDFSQYGVAGRTVYVDAVLSTNKPTTLALQVITNQTGGLSMRIGSPVPAVFERGTNVANLSDAAIGTNLLVSLSQTSGFVQTRNILEPIAVFVPEAYDLAQVKGPTSFSLLMAIPGYGSSAKDFLNNVNGWGLPNLVKLAAEKGLLLAVPMRAAVDSDGYHYWNATDACCDFGSSNRPDIAWTIAGLDAIKQVLHVDHILGLGVSNGGHLVTQLAAREAESGIEAGATLSGRGPLEDQMPPVGTNKVSLLYINSETDEVANYNGGDFGIGRFPGVEESVQIFADRYNLTNKTVITNSLDTLTRKGLDTTVIKYNESVLTTGGAEVEVWKLEKGDGSKHNPDYLPKFPEMVVDWLLKHRRPSPVGKL